MKKLLIFEAAFITWNRQSVLLRKLKILMKKIFKNCLYNFLYIHNLHSKFNLILILIIDFYKYLYYYYFLDSIGIYIYFYLYQLKNSSLAYLTFIDPFSGILDEKYWPYYSDFSTTIILHSLKEKCKQTLKKMYVRIQCNWYFLWQRSSNKGQCMFIKIL